MKLYSAVHKYLLSNTGSWNDRYFTPLTMSRNDSTGLITELSLTPLCMVGVHANGYTQGTRKLTNYFYIYICYVPFISKFYLLV